MNQRVNRTVLAAVLLGIILPAGVAFAQTSGFTYQGRLTDGGTAANGNYDLQLTLWDSLSGGAQIGSTQTLNTVAVSNGAFTVSLDFGASSFPGANRFLEISARPSGGGSFTLLTPRQQVTSTPYALRSASAANADTAASATNAATATNATQLGGVAASQYVQTNDSRLADSRPPTPGSSNYIQNSNNQQLNTNFNIAGFGSAGTLSGNTVNASREYDLNGLLFLGSGTKGNTFAGFSTGGDLGFGNTFLGQSAGGSNNPTGGSNTFVGNAAGHNNTTGGSNTFLGVSAGGNNTTAGGNTFVGSSAGVTNVTGIQHTLIGAGAGVGSDGLSNSTAIGHNARVDQSNSLVLGSINGTNGAAASTNVGIGTTAPQARLHVVGDVRVEGNITLTSLGPASSTQATLCRNTSNEIAFCNSSSLRYKNNVTTFHGGLDIISRLRPISFTWKQDGLKDIGFGAEEVEMIAPLFTFRNDKGKVEGVRYDRLGVLFVNAFKEQQAQIEEQRASNEKALLEIKQQQAEIAVLNAQVQSIKRQLRTTARTRRR